VCQLKCSIARKYVGTTESLVAYGDIWWDSWEQKVWLYLNSRHDKTNFEMQVSQRKNLAYCVTWSITFIKLRLLDIYPIIAKDPSTLASTLASSFFFFLISGVGLSPLSTAVTSGLLYKPQMIDESDCGAIGGMKIGRGNQSTRRKRAPAWSCGICGGQIAMFN
jgi:hypothetical protein